MSSSELQTLQNVYKFIDSDSKTQKAVYVLQTLWHDLTSEFDIIGPYYTSAYGLKSKFLLPCVIDAIYQFHLLRPLCDGANCHYWKHFVGGKQLTCLMMIKKTGMKYQFHSQTPLLDTRYFKLYAQLTRYSMYSGTSIFWIA